MWFWLMVVILLANGMGAFGLKMIAVWQLPHGVKFPYLAGWYATGLVTLAMPALLSGFRMRQKELTLGALMALCSVGGQLTMATALDLGVPGNIVFPVSTGGSLLIVVVAGRLFFGERMNWMTTFGVALGSLAVVLLSMS
jgi:multidrug transporter EmrE-like cation transporter